MLAKMRGIVYMITWFSSLIYLPITLGKALHVFTEVFYNVSAPGHPFSIT